MYKRQVWTHLVFLIFLYSCSQLNIPCTTHYLLMSVYVYWSSFPYFTFQLPFWTSCISITLQCLISCAFINYVHCQSVINLSYNLYYFAFSFLFFSGHKKLSYVIWVSKFVMNTTIWVLLIVLKLSLHYDLSIKSKYEINLHPSFLFYYSVFFPSHKKCL